MNRKPNELDTAAGRDLGRAPLLGLVLAGGHGRRLGRDKGAVDYHGLPQVRWALELLRRHCADAYVSVRAEQGGAAPYAGLPLIADRGRDGGPATGLLAAWERFPETAWLVLAVDLPLVDDATLVALIGARDAAAGATAFRGPDGGPEPLCAIFEPAACPRVLAEPPERRSLRRVLLDLPARLSAAPHVDVLRSVNTPDDEAAVRASIRRRAAAGRHDPA